VQKDQTVDISANLPAFTQKDFLKEIFNFFRAFVQYNQITNTVTVTTFKELRENIEKGEFDDWSDKVDTNGSFDLDFLLQYAQTNRVRWKQDKAPDQFGNAKFAIVNVNLRDERILLTTKFSSSAEVRVGPDRTQADLIIWTPGVIAGGQDTKQTEKIKPRLLYIGDSTESVDISDELTTVVNQSAGKIGKFDTQSASPNSLDFDGPKGILNKFWSEFQTAAQKSRRIRLPLRLNEKDIKELDFARPAYISTVIKGHEVQGYFYKNKIPKFDPRTTTRVELILL